MEKLDAIRRNRKSVGRGRTVATIGDADEAIVLHGCDDSVQVFSVRWDILEQNAVLYAHALADDIVDRECREHPVLHRIFAQHTFIADVVAVAVSAVAVDDDAEDVLDGLYVPDEGGTHHIHALTHLGAFPTLIDLGKRDAFSTVDGAHQPYIFFEQSRCLHKSFFTMHILERNTSLSENLGTKV